MTTPVIYQKHNSFAAMRHQAPLSDDALRRIERLSTRLDQAGLAAERKAVVAAACEELLSPPAAGAPRFILKTSAR